MLHDPVEQRFFKTDVVTCLFTLQPFMAQDFFALGEEFLVKKRLSHEFRVFCRRGVHTRNFVCEGASHGNAIQQDWSNWWS